MAKKYKEKRDFSRTPEPPPRQQADGSGPLIFTVQKHSARRLHYDFRLEWGGTLWSWAVPKGPSLNPRNKRLAVHVEDHPVEYADFEGHIPEGNYGAGTVIVWDRGLWIPIDDPDEGIETGKMHFRLQGYKLRGEWILIRTKGGAPNEWLLMKKADSHLENYLDRIDGHTKGKVVIATVFGDVHDIGKSLVNTILTNNGYTVIDLGKQVPVTKILEKAQEVNATAIGLSALLVSTSKQMPICVAELHRAGLRYPVLIGGAAINRNFARRAALVDGEVFYEPGVYYCKDAFEGLDHMNALMDPEQASALRDRNRREAFETFFDVYFSRLYRFCSARVSDPHLCEDIVQETLLKSMRKMDTYRGEASLFTWLCQICRNEISNWFKRQGRKQAPLVSLDDDAQVRSVLESLGHDDAERRLEAPSTKTATWSPSRGASSRLESTTSGAPSQRNAT